MAGNGTSLGWARALRGHQFQAFSFSSVWLTDSNTSPYVGLGRNFPTGQIGSLLWILILRSHLGSRVLVACDIEEVRLGPF